MSEEIEQHISDRFEIIKKLGKGAYGIVWKAKDKKTNKTVALKKIYDAFQNATDAQRTYREVMYLQHLNGHENIVRLFSILRATNNKDLYLAFELMETDLHVVIRAKILKHIHKKFILYQLFKALKYLHSAGLVHRDLKPSNMLINSDCVMKLADFGLARSVLRTEADEPPIVSDYIATRWYRAPEIVLGSKGYDKAVDMWSAGCILAELLLEKVLFAGKSSLNQVELFVRLLGRPNESEIKAMKISNNNSLMNRCEGKKKKYISELFKNCEEEAVDLIRKLLVYDPQKRISVEEALQHPFFSQFHNPKEEIVCPKEIVIPINDNEKLSLKVYRDAIYKNISLHIKKQNDVLKAVNFTSRNKNKAELKARSKVNKKKELKTSTKTIKENYKKSSKSLGIKTKQSFKGVERENKYKRNPLFKKKTKSEDHKKKKKRLFSTSTKFGKKVQISKSNVYANQLKCKNLLVSGKVSKEKGFFKKKRENSQSQKQIKKTYGKQRDKYNFQHPFKSSTHFILDKKVVKRF